MDDAEESDQQVELRLHAGEARARRQRLEEELAFTVTQLAAARSLEASFTASVESFAREEKEEV
jgi:hypothetical protein